jgi:serine phosphatase RsbU (regulator of sigma subunit)/NADH:ubiquinone oxidoreductase subunit E
MKKLLLLFVIVFLGLASNSIVFSQTYNKLPLTSLDSAQISKYTENYEMYLAKNDLRNASDFLNQIAVIYWTRNHFETCAEYYLKSLKLNQQLGNQNGIAGINSNLGMIYADLGQYQKSVDHLTKAVAGRRAEKNTATGRENLFNALLNLSSSLKQLGKYNEAIKYLEEALNYAKEINNLEKIAVFYLQLAELHEIAGNVKESKSYTEKYMTFYKQLKEEQVNRSKIALDNEMLRAGQIELEKKLKELELQEKTVELEKKEIQVKQYHSKADSLANTLSKAQLAKQFLEEQAERERIEQQKDKIIFISVFTILFAIAMVLLYAFYQKRKANIMLENKNTEILNQQEKIVQQRDSLDAKNKELDKKNHQILESINYAKLIQSAMLQPEQSLDAYVPDSFILFKPKNIVSGDFYWYTKKQNKLIVAVADCTGHGVPGAFMSMIGYNLLNQIVINENIMEPDEILERLNFGVISSLNQNHSGNDDGMDAALLVIDLKKKLLRFSGARNSLIIIKNGTIEEIEGDERSIGGTQINKDSSFKIREIKLLGSNYLYSFSDGYPDQFGGDKNKKFMNTRMRQLLLDIHDKKMDEQKEILENTIEYWKSESNAKQTDDILVLGMHIDL